MAVKRRDWIKYQDGVEHGAMGQELLRYIKTLPNNKNVVAERLAERLRPLLNHGGVVYYDEICKDLTESEREMFLECGRKANMGMRVAIGPYQLVNILELVDGE